jgi:DNA-binding transcriptional MerR regulator
MGDHPRRGRRTHVTDYRADELAAAAGITVALLRSYQSKGLLPGPRHVGRTAVYGDHHLERLRRIEALKARGHSLRSIAEQVDAPPGFRVDGTSGERLRLRDVSERSGVPIEMLRSLEASGVLKPRSGPDGAEYSEADVRAVGCVLLLVGSGIPFDSFLEVAQPQLRANDEVADGAVRLFREHVGSRIDDPERREESLIAMAAAIGELVAYLLERQVLAVGDDVDATTDLEHAS